MKISKTFQNKIDLKINSPTNSILLYNIGRYKMANIKLIVLALILLSISTIDVPCIPYQNSQYGTVSDCSITRIGPLEIWWSITINFKTDLIDTTYGSILAELGSLKPFISSQKWSCGGSGNNQSYNWQCYQAYASIPVGFSLVLTVFQSTTNPLGFLIKVPLSQEDQNQSISNQVGNLQLEKTENSAKNLIFKQKKVIREVSSTLQSSNEHRQQKKVYIVEKAT